MFRQRDSDDDDAEPSVLAIVLAFIVGLAAVSAVYGLITWLA